MHLNTRALRILYMGNISLNNYYGINCIILDTDSVFFALTAELDDLVRLDRVKDWPEIKEKWFCKNQKCKIPGLLKIGKNC